MPLSFPTHEGCCPTIIDAISQVFEAVENCVTSSFRCQLEIEAKKDERGGKIDALTFKLDRFQLTVSVSPPMLQCHIRGHDLTSTVQRVRGISASRTSVRLASTGAHLPILEIPIFCPRRSSIDLYGVSRPVMTAQLSGLCWRGGGPSVLVQHTRML